jgi:hypothetical protein
MITYTEEQYNDVLRSTAAEMQALILSHKEAIEAKDAELDAAKEALTGMETYKGEMIAKVSAALQSGDPTKFQALAVEFLTPAQEAARLEKIARIAELKAEAAKLEAEIAPES